MIGCPMQGDIAVRIVFHHLRGEVLGRSARIVPDASRVIVGAKSGFVRISATDEYEGRTRCGNQGEAPYGSFAE